MADWTIETIYSGSAPFCSPMREASPCLVKDADGIPHVAFQGGDYFVTYAKRIESLWTTQDIKSPSGLTDGNLLILADGSLRLSTLRWQSTGDEYPYRACKILKLADETWSETYNYDIYHTHSPENSFATGPNGWVLGIGDRGTIKKCVNC